MLAKRVIPTMLVRGRTLVKGIAFDAWRSIGHAAQAARVHARRGVDELLILDISATAEGRGPDLDLVRELSADCFIPITVGGGVRSCEDIDKLLRAGADKVAIGAALHTVPAVLWHAARAVRAQAIVCQ
jgi:cyclase